MTEVVAGDAVLEVERAGDGPVVLVTPTALVADEPAPLAHALRSSYDVVRYRRRGYGRSRPRTPSATAPKPSIVAEAADVPALMDALGLESAHVVGASFGAAIAWETAARYPDRVASLTLFEPPPVFAPEAAGPFRAANADLRARGTAAGPSLAADEFLDALSGPGWRDEHERALPGSVRAVHRDAATFFEVDIPALLAWDVTEEDARRVRAPVLLLRGSATGLWFEAGDATLRRWFRSATAEVIEGAAHGALLTHPGAVADAVSRHVRRHA
ncbi:UNVERIFIED_CONTAM: hypothetical protein LK11_04550 [Mumia flava]